MEDCSGEVIIKRVWSMEDCSGELMMGCGQWTITIVLVKRCEDVINGRLFW